MLDPHACMRGRRQETLYHGHAHRYSDITLHRVNAVCILALPTLDYIASPKLSWVTRSPGYRQLSCSMASTMAMSSLGLSRPFLPHPSILVAVLQHPANVASVTPNKSPCAHGHYYN